MNKPLVVATGDGGEGSGIALPPSCLGDLWNNPPSWWHRPKDDILCRLRWQWKGRTLERGRNSFKPHQEAQVKNSLLEGYDDGRDFVSAKRIVHLSVPAHICWSKLVQGLQGQGWNSEERQISQTTSPLQLQCSKPPSVSRWIIFKRSRCKICHFGVVKLRY